MTNSQYANPTNGQYWLPPQPPQATTYQPMPNITYRPPTVNTIVGKMVNSEADITPNEVPMDGSAGVYPTNDFSSIFVKTWNANGTISTIKYVPQAIQGQTPDTNAIILERLDKLTNMVSKIKPYQNRKVKNNASNESDRNFGKPDDK